ncbi:MAG: M56 family metallopeptidase [Clostridiales bacterium]|nr:M56 family metallopeptidase [Clostridiales bacterium]
MTQLLENSLTGTLLIFSVVLLRSLLKKYLPPETWLVMWGLCLFRLLSPIIPNSIFSIYNLPRLFASNNVKHEVLVNTDQSTKSLFSAASTTWTDTTQSLPWGIPATQVVYMIYFIGAVCIFVWFVWGWIQSYLLVRNAIPIDVLHSSYCKEYGFAKFKMISCTDQQGPFTFGVFCPVIVLTYGLSDQELRMTLLHEGIHVKRRDNLWNYIMAVALIVHWFNPAVWVLSHLLKLDIEKCCDKAVISKLGWSHRHEYAELLVKMSSKRVDYTFLAPLGSNKIKERIVFIMKLRKPSLMAIFLSVALAIFMSVTFVTAEAFDEVFSDTGEIAIEEDTSETTDNISNDVIESIEISPDGEFAVETENDDDEPEISIMGVGISKTAYKISVGSSYTTSFDMSNGFSDPYTAFKVNVKNATGSYKILISGSNGYSYASVEKTNNFSVTVKNAASGVTYSVYILNCSTSAITADISISSYYY